MKNIKKIKNQKMYENIKIYKYTCRNIQIYMQKNIDEINIKEYIKKVSMYI